jgi:rfaE bifunctional protein kinase chain/domain
MTPDRFATITDRYRHLRIAVVGDYFLDRYLHIDPSKNEISIETGLTVYNVVESRSQPGAAGTILSNLVALGIGEIHAIGFCGDDGEGYELRQALAARPGVILDGFLTTPLRRTPVYCKPLVFEPGRPPRELNRLDSKNWTTTPEAIDHELARILLDRADRLDALILLDQVDQPETGVTTARVKAAAHRARQSNPDLIILADSRRGLTDFPPLGFKMNAAELARMAGNPVVGIDAVKQHAANVSARTRQPVFVTLAEQGIVGVHPGADPEHVPAHPVHGEIDIVGAGDAVTANLASALASGATHRESMELAMAAASIVIHQLGTTGTASIPQVGQAFSLTIPSHQVRPASA